MVVLERLKKHPLVASILAVLMMEILIVCIYGFTRPDPETLISQFEQAIKQGDTARLQQLVEPENNGMNVTKDHFQQLVAYGKKNPDYVQHLVFFMHAQAIIAENVGKATKNKTVFQQYSESDIMNYGDYYIKKTDGLFPSYQIYARAHYLTVKANEPDTIIEVAGKKLSTKKDQLEITYGPIMPGTYRVIGTKKLEYGNVTGKNEVNLFDVKGMKATTSLEIGKKINVVSTQDNVTIYINGQAVDGTALKVQNPAALSPEETARTFGPLSIDGTMKIHGEIHYPWGTVKSELQTITDDTTILNLTPNLLVTAEAQDQLTKTINQFAQQSMEALVKQDPSVIQSASDNMKNKYLEQIQFEKRIHVYWKGKALGTKIDFNSVTTNNANGMYTIILPVEFRGMENQYGGNNNNDGQPLQEVRDFSMVTLSYDANSKQWMIVDENRGNGPEVVFNNENVVTSEF